MLDQKTLNRTVITAVSLGFLLLIGIGIAAAVMVQRNLDHTRWVNHTYEVEKALADFRVINERLETTRRGYLLSGDPSFQRIFEETAALQGPAISRLQALTEDNPSQRVRTARLAAMAQRQASILRSSIAGGQTSENFLDDEGVRLTWSIRAVAQQMADEESRLLVERDNIRLRGVRELLSLMLVAGVVLAIVAAGSVLTIFTYTRDLTRSRNELRLLNESLEETVAERTRDLQRANDEIQRFAYIVSHDLRSPLVNVMGFTAELEAATKPLTALIEKAEVEAPQLVTADARDAVRTDLPEAIGFIRSSTQKMDRLINAILRLSREGRRVLTPEPIDMTRMFETIADSLRHRTDELGARIDIEGPLPGLVSDRLALEQIFSNLVENGLKYLKPGRPGHLRIRGETRGGRLIYEVIDNGRGVDPRDHERIFDLFRRSGAQDQPGEGIGLAHVRALAYRLGGVVSVESALDQGSTFRVSLPAASPADLGETP